MDAPDKAGFPFAMGHPHEASPIKLAAVQLEYNLLQRTADGELVPMAAQFGLGTMMYSPLAGGMLTGKYRKGEKGRITLSPAPEYHESQAAKAIIDLLCNIAAELEATPGQAAFAWVLSKGAFPILGARTVDHFTGGIKAAFVELTADHLTQLDRLSAVTMGYPHDLLASVRSRPTV